MELFLSELSKAFLDDMILLAVDRASWHVTDKLKLPDNIRFHYLLPYTPEMNPIEQIWQTVEAKQKFIAQIMSSKSPVRSCEDVDETALRYAEIKALCAGNPLIAEKMNLDIEVAKLRMLKADHQSQHYRIEDDLLKRYPEQIISVKERIEGI